MLGFIYAIPASGTMRFPASSIGMSLGVFDMLRDVLRLESSSGDYTGHLAADALLGKIAADQAELKLHGREWEHSPEPPKEGQEHQSLTVLGFPGISRDDLDECLVVLERIACYAKEHDIGVQWS